MLSKGVLAAGVSLYVILQGLGATKAYAQDGGTAPAIQDDNANSKTEAATSDDEVEQDKKTSDSPDEDEPGETTGEDTTEKAQEVLTGREEEDAKITNDTGRLSGEIVVVGLRANVKTARNAKRNAQQIVDVVLAQDIGKLPDKNVPEALARVPGVQIERNRGEGGSVLIRGLDNVMTTVNGSPTFSAGDRTTYLNDISSDLVAGIEVFKTRTPDQVEGSQTGVINLTLRRPTDFKEGFTYAVSLRGDYSDLVKKVNPFLSGLIAYNADTPIGEIGYSLNATYNYLQYSEGIRFNARPRRPGDNRQIILPSTTSPNIYIPNDIGYAGNNGYSRRAAMQFSTQWKPDPDLALTLEGGWSNQRMLWADNLFIIPLLYSGSAAPPPILSNLILGSDGRLAQSLSANSVDPVGPGRQSWKHETKNYNGRLQLQYDTDRVSLLAWLNYAHSDNQSNSIFHYIRFNQQPEFDVVFNTPDDPQGGSSINFKNIDLLDPDNYLYIDGFRQSNQFTDSGEIEAKFDLRINTFGQIIDWFKVGFRYANRTYDRGNGDRGLGNLRIPISELPDYTLSPIDQNFGPTNANWLIGDSDSIRRSFADIRSRLTGIDPTYANAFPEFNPLDGFNGSDGSYAAYGQFHYDIKVLFPIEGIIGARVVNSVTALNALGRTTQFENVDGRLTLVTRDETISPRGNYVDILPSVNAIVHITDRLQFRASYTYDVGRPSVYQINPRLVINGENAIRPTAFGGNSDLGPVTLTKYDLSLEWYFGSTGSASIAAWEWQQDGLVANRQLPEILPEFPDVTTLVNRPYNLGRGRHRGIEASVTSFFTFLPGFLSSFGAAVNGTLNITRQAFPQFDEDGNATFVFGPYLNVSKYVFNTVGFFERDGINMRVAYNWRSRRQLFRDLYDPYNNLFLNPVERLDVSVSYDITENLTLAGEATNLTKSGNRDFWGTYDLPRNVKLFARTYSLSLRARF